MSTKESLSNKTMLYLYPSESIVEEHQRVQWKIEENSINDKSFHLLLLSSATGYGSHPTRRFTILIETQWKPELYIRQCFLS